MDTMLSHTVKNTDTIDKAKTGGKLQRGYFLLAQSESKI